MDNKDVHKCLEEILKDENGNAIEPSCGIEKLLCLMCENISSEKIEAITIEELDEIMSQ